MLARGSGASRVLAAAAAMTLLFPGAFVSHRDYPSAGSVGGPLPFLRCVVSIPQQEELSLGLAQRQRRCAFSTEEEELLVRASSMRSAFRHRADGTSVMCPDVA